MATATGGARQEIEHELARRGTAVNGDGPPDRSGLLSAAVPTLPVLLEDVGVLTGILEHVPWRDVYRRLPTPYGDAVDLLAWMAEAHTYAEAHAGRGMARMARVLADVLREMQAHEPTCSQQTLYDLADVVVMILGSHGETREARQAIDGAPRPVRAVLLDFCARVLTHGAPAWEGGPRTPAPYKLGAVAECLTRPVLFRRLAAVCGVRLHGVDDPPDDEAQDGDDAHDDLFEFPEDEDAEV
jgi:hypothetical protein